MLKNILTLAVIFIVTLTGFAQVGIGTTIPDASSALDVTATDKGFLMPRMTTVQREAIVSPTEGLQVYDNETKSVWTFDGTVWKEGSGGAGKFVDGATADIAYYEGKVGIGRNTFGNSHKLWVENIKDVNETNIPIKIYAGFNGTGTTVSTVGLASEAHNLSTGIIQNAAGVLGIVDNGAGASIDNGFGSWNYILNHSSIAYGAGAYDVIYNYSGGTLTTGIGTLGGLENYAGAQIDIAVLGNFYTTNNGALNKLYGNYLAYYGTGTVTDSYGIYIDQGFDKGTGDNFAFYSAPDIDSFFQGNVGFGVESPLQKVHINGVMRLEPQAAQPINGALGDLYVGIDGKLYFHNGIDWKEVQLVP